MSNPGERPKSRSEDSARDAEHERGGYSIPGGVRVRSVYLPTVEATLDVVFDRGLLAYRESDTLFEVPADQYQESVRRIDRLMAGLDSESAVPEPDGAMLLRRGTVAYRQAVRIARIGRIDGVVLDEATGAVQCECAYGLSFALEHARAIWAGGSDRAAVAMALGASLKAGSSSAVHSLLYARFTPTPRVAEKSARTDGALCGVTNSPLGHGASERALRALSAMTSPAGAGRFELLAGSTPLASTVAIGVANLDFYRAALQRSISWTQFTKNVVVKTTGLVVGVGGWAGGAVLGSTICGPLGALVGGIAGALSVGGAGAVGAKRIADRFVEDDALRLMSIVRQASAQLAFEYLLTAEEIDRFAARIKTLVDAAWLRLMFQAGRAAARSAEGDEAGALRRFADQELDKLCREIVELRASVVLPSVRAVNLLLCEIGLLESPAARKR